MQNREVC